MTLRTPVVVLAAVSMITAAAVPAQAAASACTHHWSGPQICISTTGEGGSVNPGRVTAAWTNPPRGTKSARVRFVLPDGFTYTLTAHRSRRGQLVVSDHPGMQPTGRLCVRFEVSSRRACVEIIDRNMT